MAGREYQTGGVDDQNGFIKLPSLQRSPPPPVQYPLGLVTFSYTPSRTLEFTNSALKYFHPPLLNVSLKRGYNSWIKRPEERGRLDGLLQAIQHPHAQAEARRADVVTWRGIITKFLVAPYETRDGWNLNIMIVKGVMYLEEHATDAEISNKEQMTPDHRLMSYYGYSFESYCTTTDPIHPGTPLLNDGWGGNVDTNVQWCSVIKTKIAQLRVILGGEVDCVRDQFTGQPNTFVELKTSMAIRNQNDRNRFHQKLLKFWAQSFLLGVPEVFVGFRDRDGTIVQTQSFETLKMPGMVSGQQGEWHPGVCLNYANECLSYLKAFVQRQQGGPQDESRVWRVRFEPRSGMYVRELSPEEVAEVANEEDRVGFLPRSFVLH